MRDDLISEQNHMLVIVNLENQKHQNALELASMNFFEIGSGI
jgi:hypothetical protein